MGHTPECTSNIGMGTLPCNCKFLTSHPIFCDPDVSLRARIRASKSVQHFPEDIQRQFLDHIHLVYLIGRIDGIDAVNRIAGGK